MKSFESPIMNITYFNVNDVVTCSGDTASTKARAWLTSSVGDKKSVEMSNILEFTKTQ